MCRFGRRAASTQDEGQQKHGELYLVNDRLRERLAHGVRDCRPQRAGYGIVSGVGKKEEGFVFVIGLAIADARSKFSTGGMANQRVCRAGDNVSVPYKGARERRAARRAGPVLLVVVRVR
jgi:hypothetical protein